MKGKTTQTETADGGFSRLEPIFLTKISGNFTFRENLQQP